MKGQSIYFLGSLPKPLHEEVKGQAGEAYSEEMLCSASEVGGGKLFFITGLN